MLIAVAIGMNEMSGHRWSWSGHRVHSRWKSIFTIHWISLGSHNIDFMSIKNSSHTSWFSRAANTRREEILRFRTPSAVGGKISAKTRPNIHTLASLLLLLPSRSTPSSASPENNSTEKWINYISASIAPVVRAAPSLLEAVTKKKDFHTQVLHYQVGEEKMLILTFFYNTLFHACYCFYSSSDPSTKPCSR